jgi:PAS domain S-box-containing protein
VSVGIRLKLIAFTVSVVLLTGGSISLYSIYQARARIFATFDHEARQVTELLAETVLNDLYFLNIHGVRLHLGSARINPDIRYTVVTDLQGLVLTDGTTENPGRGQPLPATYGVDMQRAAGWMSRIQDRMMNVSGPIEMADGTRIGYLVVGYSLERPYEVAQESRRASLWITVICLAIGGALGFVFATRVSRDLSALVRASVNIGQGKLETRVGVKRRDEFGLLGASINRMAESLSATTVSKQYLDNIVHSMGDALIVVNPDRTIRTVNEATLGLLGYEERGLLGQRVDLICGEGPLVDALFEKLVKVGGITSVEMLYADRDGRKIPVSFSGSVILDERGEVEGIVCVAKDITERKRAEEALEVANTQLQEIVQLAENASRHKSEFLSNMSHELRTPLNSVLGFSQLLETQTAGPLTEKQARYVNNILGSGRHLLTLINDILDLSKVEAGKVELQPEPFALPEALAEALTEIRPQATAKRVEFQLEMNNAPPLVTADPVRFKQILLNLLSNAVKFTPDGGRVTVSARPPQDGFVEIAVADTGIGIKAEDIPRLFQPFTQLEAASTKQYQGTGLGLALTKKLVELHGGTIAVGSEGAGKGTTFTVRLPLAISA